MAIGRNPGTGCGVVGCNNHLVLLVVADAIDRQPSRTHRQSRGGRPPGNLSSVGCLAQRLGCRYGGGLPFIHSLNGFRLHEPTMHFKG